MSKIAKVRVSQLAKELGVQSKDIIARCTTEGLDEVKQPQSTIHRLSKLDSTTEQLGQNFGSFPKRFALSVHFLTLTNVWKRRKSRRRG